MKSVPPTGTQHPVKTLEKLAKKTDSNVKCNDRSKIEHLEAALHHLTLAGENKLALQVKLRLIELG